MKQQLEPCTEQLIGSELGKIGIYKFGFRSVETDIANHFRESERKKI